MKKIVFLLVAVFMWFTTPVMADGFNGNSRYQSGGFNNDNMDVITIKQAKNISGKAWVKLRGSIAERVGENDYLFKDDTDSIRVEIDSKYWQGRNVNSKNILEITGELEQKWNSVEVDVKNIEIIK